MEVVFWSSAALVLYAYALYPLVILIASRLCGQSRCVALLADQELPQLTLLIAAHNEQAVIGLRLQNALAMDYPPEKLQIIVTSDGSTDRTAEIVGGFASQGVQLIHDADRLGKAARLNLAMPQSRGEIVLFSDANTFSEPQAARRLVRWFHEPAVGAVCGRLILTDPATGRNVDSMYWRYETFLKTCEARLGALLGANGAIYAMRRERFVAIPNDTMVDDFVIPLLARLKSRCQIVYDADAIATEETPPSMQSEFRRRARIGAGGFQSIGLLWKLLDPRQGWLAFSFFSHKVLRWCCPFFLILLLASNLLLLHDPLYRVLLAIQVGFYSTSVLGMWLPGSGRVARSIRLTTMFTSMNLALLVGFFRWLSGQQRGVWQRTSR